MCKCFYTCVCVPDLFTPVIWVYFICQNFWHTKNLTKKCRCFWTSFVFSVLEYTQFCIFSGIRVSRAISSCCSVFLYCVLCCLGTELENSKWGLHFCCQVHVFAIFLEAMLKLILDYLTRTKWNGKELMEKVPKQWGEKRVPRKIKIWAWHSGEFCFQIFWIVLALLLRLFSGPWRQKWRW